MTFAEEIEQEAGNEEIVAAVIGRHPWGSYTEDEIERKADVERDVLLRWAEARPMLDYAYDAGYGAPSCDAIWVWTTERVIFVSQYDGSTMLESVPRNPKDGSPTMPGQS